MKTRYWEIASFFFIVIAGTMLHFAYSETGSLAVSPFAPVNESIWEHLKLAVWPAAVFGLLEYFFVRWDHDNFLVARICQIYVMPTVILGVFYGYSALTGDSILAVDILTFVFAVMVGQVVSYALMMRPRLPVVARRVAVVAGFVILAVLVLFTYLPPHLGLFEDGNN